MDQVQRPKFTLRDACTRLADHRVVAVDEGDGGNQSGRGSQRRERPCIVQRRRQRFLADHVLAGFQRGLRHRAVQVVGRADVHDLYLGSATTSLISR